MGQQYLIDSNVVIDYLSGKLPQKGMVFMNRIINDIPVLSVITKIEVLGFVTTPAASQLLIDFINDSLVIGLPDNIVEKTIEIRKQIKLKTPDAIIAASALVNGFILLSRNTKDFISVKDLKVIDPYQF